MSENRSMQYAEILSKLIQVETISSRENKDITKFLGFHKVLRETFPNFFNTVECEEFDGSLLLKWKGTDSSLEPIMLMNHHDVVEASGNWTHPPFSGAIADGRVWGRGTLDTKGGLVMMLQAAEELIKEGFTPKRDTYFVTACTEEIGGEGAAAMSEALAERKMRFHMILDEGGMILHDPIGGADGTFAMIGVGEKGYVDLKFIAKSNGGHASAPGKNTPLVRLGKFMAEAEKAECFDVYMSDTVKEILTRFAPTMSGIMKAACGNVNTFKPVLKKVMPMISPAGAAMLRTTLAFTMSKGSDGTNVIPQEAWVVGNMRFSHHQGKKSSVDAITALAKKYDIETIVTDDGIESGITDFKGEAFKFIEKAVTAVFPEYKAVPYIMNAATDSRYFGKVCDNCLRFVPFKIDNQQLDSVHGIDENVDVATLAPAVDFYKYVIKEA
ncbi:MAG: M20/M25/M40 family metallo-hydrolase [Clostridia bacterium]|nr:M20/M25/M40 family metallo-hydrolase [Clostridia bacterium]